MSPSEKDPLDTLFEKRNVADRKKDYGIEESPQTENSIDLEGAGKRWWKKQEESSSKYISVAHAYECADSQAFRAPTGMSAVFKEAFTNHSGFGRKKAPQWAE